MCEYSFRGAFIIHDVPVGSKKKKKDVPQVYFRITKVKIKF